METNSPAEVLGPTRLSAPFRSREIAGVAFAGRALYDGCIAISRWPRSVVETFLPPELELVPVAEGSTEEHPVIVIFGQQRETALIFGGVVMPVGRDYDEFGITVPFVRVRSSGALSTYVPTMYASYFSATWVGTHLFGLGKRIASEQSDGPLSVWTDENGRAVFHAIVEPCSSGSETVGCEPSDLETLRRVATLPVVGQRHDGRWMGCYFDWDFSGARSKAVRCSMSIDEELRAGVPERTFVGEPGATIWVEGMVWRLSWPFRCGV